jgi:hypothetical protein
MRRRDPQEWQAVADAYLTGSTTTELAEARKCHPSTVYRALLALGVPVDKRSRRRKPRATDWERHGLTDDDCRRAHAAWARGERDEVTHLGEREWQRRRKPRARARAAFEGVRP